MRILLVDDQLMFREGLKALLSRQEDLEVVAEADTGRKALSLAEQLLPDLVIMDISMPDLNGIEATRLLRAAIPGMAILALSQHSEHHIIIEMLRAGASGYVLKGSPFTELLEALHTLEKKELFVSPKASAALVMDYVHSSAGMDDSAFSILTGRELEILQSIAEGKSTKEIAGELSISTKTVETHRQQIMEKLDIHSIAQLTKYAIREEITSI